MTQLIRNMLDGAKTIIQIFPPSNLPKLESVGRYSVNQKRTAAESLASDWQAVGNDLRKAMGAMENEIKQARH